MIRVRDALVLLLIAGLLASCVGPASVPSENRARRYGRYAVTPDGYYRVRRGDNLAAISFKFGLDWREIARLNGLSAPYTIYPDQLLRLTWRAPRVAAAPPAKRTNRSSSVRISGASSPAAATTHAIETRGTRSSQAEENRTVAQRANASPHVAGTRSGEASVKGTKAPAGRSYSTPAGDPRRWLWPTQGKLLNRFQAGDPARKGIDISGRPGQPVVASAAGKVVYSGSGLIGYGELIIIKHSDRMLSAYAHNSKRLVREGQQVAAGSKIAEMGTNDRNQAMLHFEIRVNGSPKDPLRYLPRR